LPLSLKLKLSLLLRHSVLEHALAQLGHGPARLLGGLADSLAACVNAFVNAR
jgi:hypothetical protein